MIQTIITLWTSNKAKQKEFFDVLNNDLNMLGFATKVLSSFDIASFQDDKIALVDIWELESYIKDFQEKTNTHYDFFKVLVLVDSSSYSESVAPPLSASQFINNKFIRMGTYYYFIELGTQDLPDFEDKVYELLNDNDESDDLMAEKLSEMLDTQNFDNTMKSKILKAASAI